ncbi:MAG: hypothetical protein R2851_14945 [Caldilineaceae bacterium]
MAPYTVVAPKRITYDSQVLTEEARERAALSVPEQYDVAEGRIRRRQVESRQRDPRVHGDRAPGSLPDGRRAH